MNKLPTVDHDRRRRRALLVFQILIYGYLFGAWMIQLYMSAPRNWEWDHDHRISPARRFERLRRPPDDEPRGSTQGRSLDATRCDLDDHRGPRSDRLPLVSERDGGATESAASRSIG